MDVLTPAPTATGWRRAAAATLLAGWVLVAACLSWPTARRAEPSFPHRVHVVDNDLACSFCHGHAKSADDPGMPPPELCAQCHDRFDGDKPPARRVRAFYDEQSRYRRVADAGLPGDVRFSHRAHVTGARLDCVACHADVGEQDEVPLQPLASKPQCMDCHAQSGKSNACAECHASIDATWRPPSHGGQWPRVHGAHVGVGADGSADRCSLCHDEATGCRACHEQNAPRSHDQTFRLRTHGLLASMDRSRCAVCHTQDSCQQCHETTEPRSHRAGFGEPLQRHCGSCHLPLADNGCAVCHRGTPSHDSATALPAGHTPAMNCRLCHGNGVRLPHPDNGHVCTVCHR